MNHLAWLTQKSRFRAASSNVVQTALNWLPALMLASRRPLLELESHFYPPGCSTSAFGFSSTTASLQRDDKTYTGGKLTGSSVRLVSLQLFYSWRTRFDEERTGNGNGHSFLWIWIIWLSSPTNVDVLAPNNFSLATS